MEPLEWEVRMWERVPGKRPILLSVALAVALIGQWYTKSWLVGLAAFMAIVATTAEMWFPLKYRLDENEARVRCGLSVTAIRWANIKRLIEVEGGIRLSPLDRASRLDAFRGVHLRFAGNEETVLGKIRALWQRHVRVLGERADA
ncbi:MAG: hypothetical protein KF884_03000 [Fimbriimonadaceae bacterium]|nr:hypothetical protein [Fimbriimonadaceae bacterium]QYK59064.1 MAG: hypothetical protein KF884_03000 [Fimbriimonadaceae bacterium]